MQGPRQVDALPPAQAPRRSRRSAAADRSAPHAAASSASGGSTCAGCARPALRDRDRASAPSRSSRNAPRSTGDAWLDDRAQAQRRQAKSPFASAGPGSCAGCRCASTRSAMRRCCDCENQPRPRAPAGRRWQWWSWCETMPVSETPPPTAARRASRRSPPGRDAGMERVGQAPATRLACSVSTGSGAQLAHRRVAHVARAPVLLGDAALGEVEDHAMAQSAPMAGRSVDAELRGQRVEQAQVASARPGAGRRAGRATSRLSSPVAHAARDAPAQALG